MNSDNTVPDSNNGTSAFGCTHLSTVTASLDANSPSTANVRTDIQETKQKRYALKNIEVWAIQIVNRIYDNDKRKIFTR